MAEFGVFVRSWDGWTLNFPSHELALVPPEGGVLHAEVKRLAESLAHEYPGQVERERAHLASQSGTGRHGGPFRPPELVEVVGRVFGWFQNPVRAADYPPEFDTPIPQTEVPGGDEKPGRRVYPARPRYRVSTWESWLPGIPNSATYLITVEDEFVAALLVATTSSARDTACLGYQALADLSTNSHLSIRRQVARPKDDPADQEDLELLRDAREILEAVSLSERVSMIRELADMRSQPRLGGPVLPEGWVPGVCLRTTLTRLADAVPAATGSEDSADPPNFDAYVTLDQAAAVIPKGKRTLERWLKKGNLPAADVRGGGGRPSTWRWSTLRPALEKEVGRSLPLRFPAGRIVG